MVGLASLVLAVGGVFVGALSGVAAGEDREGYVRGFMAVGMTLAALAVALARFA